MTQADRVHSTPRTDSSSSDPQFATLAEAEAFLQSQGFRLIPDSCNWTNDDGDAGGCYSIEDGPYGAVKGFRVEITRRGETPLSEFDDQLGMAWWNSLSRRVRSRWMREAGDTGGAKDAWEAFKAATDLGKAVRS